MTGRPQTSWQGVSRSVEQTQAAGSAVAALAKPGDWITLIGPLGAGKTQFVRGLAAGLGLDPRQVSSPTFVIAHEYESPEARAPLVHIDAYRLTSLEQLASAGLEDPADWAGEAVVAVEWADRLDEPPAEHVLAITLAHDGEQRRRVTMTAQGAWHARLPELAERLTGVLGQASDGPQR